MNCVIRKPAFCICENKGTDQLRSNRSALLFLLQRKYTPLLPKSKISSLYPSSAAVQPGLCRTWLKSSKTGFLVTQLIYFWLQLAIPSSRYLVILHKSLRHIYIYLQAHIQNPLQPTNLVQDMNNKCCYDNHSPFYCYTKPQFLLNLIFALPLIIALNLIF